ncbi:Dynamin [Gracilaria domingensis]|nr:Dynamin [Gracilaria domingensis]
MWITNVSELWVSSPNLDLLDTDINPLHMLPRRIILLNRGYVVVMNNKQTWTRKRQYSNPELQRTFFKSHPVYVPYAAKMDSQYLAEILRTMLMEHIRHVLPSIRAKIKTQLAEVREQLAAQVQNYVVAVFQVRTLLHVLTGFASSFTDAFDGRPRAPIATSELAGGARISLIVHDRFGRELTHMYPFHSRTMSEVSRT